MNEQQIQQQKQIQSRSIQDQRKVDFYNSVFGPTGGQDFGEQKTEEKRNKERKQKTDDVDTFQNNVDEEREPNNHRNKEFSQNKPRRVYSQNHSNGPRGQKFDKFKSKNFKKQRDEQKQRIHEQQTKQIQKMQNKVTKLKQRKKKFIKKMGQKTKKGQPIMNNYVKYALSKIQQGIAQDKLNEKSQKYKTNQKNNKSFSNHNNDHYEKKSYTNNYDNKTYEKKPYQNNKNWNQNNKSNTYHSNKSSYKN